MASASFWRAWLIWIVSVAVSATSLASTTLDPLPAKLAVSGNGLDWVAGIVFIGAFATVGALLVWKRSANPSGWLLSTIGLVFAVVVFSGFLGRFPRMVTLADWLPFLYFVNFGLCGFVVLLFPGGKLPSRRWRPVAWAGGAGMAC